MQSRTYGQTGYSDTNMPDVPSDDEAEANGVPKTGDSIMTSVIYGSALVLSLETVYVAFRKKRGRELLKKIIRSSSWKYMIVAVITLLVILVPCISVERILAACR